MPKHIPHHLAKVYLAAQPAVGFICGAQHDRVLDLRNHQELNTTKITATRPKALDQNATKCNAKTCNVPPSWALYGAQRDRTLGLRNQLAMWFGRTMGRYAARTQYFELVLVQVGWYAHSYGHTWKYG